MGGENNSILELSFQMGETLLRNGAEISRVQETMERVAQSYHAESFNVYVLTNGIFAVGKEQGKERSVELRHIISTNTLSKFLTNLSASALVALVGGVLFLLGLGHNMDKVIIGSIIRLVPGMALTTSIRDFFHGDYLSGAIRMLDAVLVGGCIAVGVGVVVRLLSLLTGGALL